MRQVIDSDINLPVTWVEVGQYRRSAMRGQVCYVPAVHKNGINRTDFAKLQLVLTYFHCAHVVSQLQPAIRRNRDQSSVFNAEYP